MVQVTDTVVLASTALVSSVVPGVEGNVRVAVLIVQEAVIVILTVRLAVEEAAGRVDRRIGGMQTAPLGAVHRELPVTLVEVAAARPGDLEKMVDKRAREQALALLAN